MTRTTDQIDVRWDIQTVVAIRQKCLEFLDIQDEQRLLLQFRRHESALVRIVAQKLEVSTFDAVRLLNHSVWHASVLYAVGSALADLGVPQGEIFLTLYRSPRQVARELLGILFTTNTTSEHVKVTSDYTGDQFVIETQIRSTEEFEFSRNRTPYDAAFNSSFYSLYNRERFSNPKGDRKILGTLWNVFYEVMIEKLRELNPVVNDETGAREYYHYNCIEDELQKQHYTYIHDYVTPLMAEAAFRTKRNGQALGDAAKRQWFWKELRTRFNNFVQKLFCGTINALKPAIA